MTANGSDEESAVRTTAAQYATTHWSTVLRAGDTASPESEEALEALEKLCRAYCYPLYAYVGRRGYFSMDFVAGPNLAQLVEDRPLGAEMAARYLLNLEGRSIAASQSGRGLPQSKT
jgi:hypothetical protein